MSICLNVKGEWIDADVLRTQALDATEKHLDLVLDFSGLRHLDASSFQVLLAVEQAGWIQTGRVTFAHVSDEVSRSFMHAGAATLLSAGTEAER